MGWWSYTGVTRNLANLPWCCFMPMVLVPPKCSYLFCATLLPPSPITLLLKRKSQDVIQSHVWSGIYASFLKINFFLFLFLSFRLSPPFIQNFIVCTCWTSFSCPCYAQFLVRNWSVGAGRLSVFFSSSFVWWQTNWPLMKTRLWYT